MARSVKVLKPFVEWLSFFQVIRGGKYVFSEGQVLDNTYRLIRLIGSGGMGAVYEATHARLAGRYAIKVLLERLSENPDMLARFEREAKITSLLQHPNVVQVIDHNTAPDGTEYLVMEYLDGQSLAQRMANEAPMPLATTVEIVQQIAAGLAAAHAHGIVHRDLKPENVLLIPVEGRDSDLAKILDFGVSKLREPGFEQQVTEGTLFGTPLYMAPEQVQGRNKDVDASTDQFSLAVIAYEMLTGRNPFQGETIADVFQRVLRSVPAPTGVGMDVDMVLHRGLAKAGRHRFPTVTDFADALGAASAQYGDATRGELRRSSTTDYMVGEVRNARRRKWPTRGRSWSGVLGMTIAATIAMSFVVGGAANRDGSDGLPTVAAAAGSGSEPVALRAAVEGGDRIAGLDRDHPRSGEHDASDRDPRERNDSEQARDEGGDRHNVDPLASESASTATSGEIAPAGADSTNDAPTVSPSSSRESSAVVSRAKSDSSRDDARAAASSTRDSVAGADDSDATDRARAAGRRARRTSAAARAERDDGPDPSASLASGARARAARAAASASAPVDEDATLPLNDTTEGTD